MRVLETALPPTVLEAAETRRRRSRASLSPRKSPKKSAFQIVKGTVSFTPQKTKQPPRAWERKPATPFVPRDDKQKIWKRVVLGELGVDGNQHDQGIRREDALRKDYQRVVKKQKTAHTVIDDDDKENVFSDIKGAGESVQVSRSTSFVSTRLEIDELHSSPKKKARSSVPQVESEEPGTDSEEEESGEVQHSDGNTGCATTQAHEHNEEAVCQLRQESEFHGNDLDLRTADDFEDDESSGEAESDHHDEEAINMSDHERSSSPPTILGESIVIDELHEKQLEETPLFEAKTLTKETTTQQKPAHEDDADYLRDFMSRSKASRAAREQAMLNAASEEAHVDEPTTEEDKPADVQEEEAQPHDLIEQLQEPAEMESIHDRSPLRRSKRSAVTSHSRPAPNAIQLKRANGNEFIFSANKPSSSANVALTTRSNTKKNKGTAQDVKIRLEELAAEEVAMQDGIDLSNPKQEKKRSKLEKRNANVKAKKVLRWNDENLVSYQEAEPALNQEPEDVDGLDAGRTDTTEEANKHVRLVVKPPRHSTHGTDNASDQTRRSVRKVRHGFNGTVNGTPAPKKRSQRLQAQEDDQPQIESAHQPAPILAAPRHVDVATFTSGQVVEMSPNHARGVTIMSASRSRTSIPRATSMSWTVPNTDTVHGNASTGRSLRTRQ